MFRNQLTGRNNFSDNSDFQAKHITAVEQAHELKWFILV